MPDENAEAPPRESGRAEVGDEIDAVVPQQVRFDGLPVFAEELEEAGYSPRLTPCSSESRFMSRFGDPPFEMNSS